MQAINKIYYFKNQAVRDFAWAIDSAPIVEQSDSANYNFFTTQECENYYEKFEPILNSLDKNPSVLEEHLRQKNSALIGKRFENLVEFWLKNDSDIELLASNIQIPPKGNTIGEIDFLYYDKLRNNFVHLEVAGKFYLWNGRSENTENFVSPNPNDNLKKKLEQITQKQILLSSTAEGKEVLKKFGVENPEKRICFKGYIFYPLNNHKSFTDVSRLFPQNHSKGFWIKKDDFHLLNGDAWFVIPREKWISPVCCENEFLTKRETIDYLNNYFSKYEYPLLLAEIGFENGIAMEKRRIFVLA